MPFFLNTAFDTSVQMPLTENVLVYVQTCSHQLPPPPPRLYRPSVKFRDFRELYLR